MISSEPGWLCLACPFPWASSTTPKLKRSALVTTGSLRKWIFPQSNSTQSTSRVVVITPDPSLCIRGKLFIYIPKKCVRPGDFTWPDANQHFFAGLKSLQRGKSFGHRGIQAGWALCRSRGRSHNFAFTDLVRRSRSLFTSPESFMKTVTSLNVVESNLQPLV